MAKKNNQSTRFINDQEIDLRNDDLFDSFRYSETLVDTIKNSPMQPFTIGLFGEWGSGKSSIVKTAQNILNDEKTIKYHFFTYDAWKYSNDSFRRTFLLNLAESLNLEGKDLFKSFYEARTETHQVKRVANKGLIILIVIFLLIVIALPIFSSSNDKLSWTLQAVLTAVTILISFSTNLFREYVGTKQSPILFSPEQFEACFDEILSIVMKKTSISTRIWRWFKGDDYKNNIDRMIIVIDNIDRCDKENAYKLLSDFKNFLGKDRVVFVIPVDDNALRTHVSSINKSDDREADEFLRKVFNNTLKIKPYKAHDLYDFTNKLSSKHGLNLKPDTIDVIAKEYATNPRRIIQFLNSLASEKNYMSRRMDSEFISKYETLIALVLIIREEWPNVYHKLSDAPYKLKSLNQSLALVEDNNIRLEVFLRKTNPHTVNIEDKALKVIFTNQDQNPHVSDDLINAISSRNTSSIEEFTKTSAEGEKYIVDFMIGELRQAVERSVLSSLASTFNNIVYFNSIYHLPESMNKRVLGELNRDETINLCMTHSDDPKNLAIYLNDLDSQSLHRPINLLLDSFEEKNLNELDKESKSSWYANLSSVVKNLAIYFKRKEVLLRLQDVFYIAFKIENFCIEDLNIPKENLPLVINDKLVDLNIELDSYADKARHNELIYLIKNNLVSRESIKVWFQGLIAYCESIKTSSKDIFIQKFKNANEVLVSHHFDLTADLLQSLVDFPFVIRQRNVTDLPVVNISIFSEIQAIEDDVKVLVDLLGSIYAATSEKVLVIRRFTEIFNVNEQNQKIVLQKMNWLHHQFNFTLDPFHDFLVNQSQLSTNLLEIYEWLLVVKMGDKYALSDPNAISIIQKCVEKLISNTKSDELVRLFDVWVQDVRVKETLTKVVSNQDKSVISSLPLSVQATAYSHISDGDNIFTYEDDYNILAAMNVQANASYNKKIERVIINKLNKEESFEDGISLLEQLVSFKGMKTQSIRSLLDDKVDDPEIGERVKLCLERLQ